ncbi:MAG: hypothetical protein V7700_11810 [Halioglobus sp.]
MWKQILRRLERIEVVGDVERVLSNFVKGYTSVPVILHPRARRSAHNPDVIPTHRQARFNKLGLSNHILTRYEVTEREVHAQPTASPSRAPPPA